MTRVANWFERKFEFSFPVELFPNLETRLRGTAARLEELVRDRPRDLLVRRPAPGKWSAQEHVGHLLDLEPLWMSRVDDYLAGRPELTRADLSNRRTDEANHNARPVADILAEFRTMRLRLVSRAAGFGTDILFLSRPHPRLQVPMRLLDHLYFAAEHDDHHLAKIWELLNPGDSRS